MKLNVVLTVTAVYMALLGLGFIFAPQAIGVGAVPADAPAALIAYLRVFGGTFLGIAVLNWTARNAEPSTARKAIILGNIVGFSVGPAVDVWGLQNGARPVAAVFLVIHLLIALAFIWAWRSSMNLRSVVLTFSLLSLGSACSPRTPSTDGPRSDWRKASVTFYHDYGEALRAHRRETMAQYYSPEGALIVFNGRPRRLSQAGLDSLYRGPWQGPAFFAWDSLRFDSLSPGEVLVTGHFNWQSTATSDTGRFVYAAVLQALDSGLAIRFEHETSAPRP